MHIHLDLNFSIYFFAVHFTSFNVLIDFIALVLYQKLHLIQLQLSSTMLFVNDSKLEIYRSRFECDGRS